MISIQRLGVVVVEVVLKCDCTRSDFVNCNLKNTHTITITLRGGLLWSANGLAKVRAVPSLFDCLSVVVVC